MARFYGATVPREFGVPGGTPIARWGDEDADWADGVAGGGGVAGFGSRPAGDSACGNALLADRACVSSVNCESVRERCAAVARAM